MTGKLQFGKLKTPEVEIIRGTKGFEDIYKFGGTDYVGFKFTTKF